ncbi:acyl carrier protein phosphodiesterase [Raoultella planticola]|uniref:Acyl carrier protein phosphodiesterase n=1 Tax=Raoultella planticola TaxID=575 RepID=A0A485ALW5_RAOPL|nr:acyl carrier protein phosphodiesterase [Raoultella planticola]
MNAMKIWTLFRASSNGMASRRPRLDALRDSWQDLDTHYDKLEQQFWTFYPRMMAQAARREL